MFNGPAGKEGTREMLIQGRGSNVFVFAELPPRQSEEFTIYGGLVEREGEVKGKSL